MELIDPFGNRKEYAAEKIIDSVTRAGMDRDVAEQVEERVRDRVEDGMQTKRLYRIVYQEMREENPSAALRYRLREAIGALDPQRHEFEQYMAALLAEEGFETAWSPRPLPQGACSTHEIDVVAEQAGTTFAVECKHHYHYHRLTGMDVPMLQWATVDDLQDGYAQGLEDAVDVDRPWVVVNTKLSAHAKEYAECKGVRMTAWNYPDGDGLREMVERHRAYPITILRVSAAAKRELSDHRILTVQQLLDLSKAEQDELSVPNATITDLQQKASDILDHG